MKQKVFAVCDLEAAYAYNFMDYVNQKKKTTFEVKAFTSPETLATFARDHEIEILLISSRAMCEMVRALSIGQIFILSEGEIVKDLASYPMIYKYQSSHNVVKEVMDYYAKSASSSAGQVLKKEVKMIGIYSPVRRTLKTSFALTLGQILAKDKRVLYINLEEFSGFEGLLGKEFQADLSDLLYFLRQKETNLLPRLSAVVQHIENLDYIPPASVYKDIRTVTCEEWKLFFLEIMRCSLYEVLIIDFGDSVDELCDLLHECEVVYMPIRDDPVSAAKIRQFEKTAVAWIGEELLSKIKKQKLPFHNNFGSKDFYVNQLVWSELGDYVRELIRNDRL